MVKPSLGQTTIIDGIQLNRLSVHEPAEAKKAERGVASVAGS